MVPSESGISSAPAVAPKVVRGWSGPSTSISGCADLRLGRRRGDDRAAGVGDKDSAAAAPLDRLRDDLLGAVALRLGPRRLAVEAAREEVGEQLDLVHRADRRLAVMVEDLHAGADRHGEEKRDDQQRNGASQRGLGNEKPPIGGLGKRLSQSLDRIRTGRRARNLSRRHRCAPEKMRGGMSPNHPQNHQYKIESRIIVESPRIANCKLIMSATAATNSDPTEASALSRCCAAIPPA